MRTRIACAVLAGVFLTTTANAQPPQIGYASWYGARHHGLRTASGETFNSRAVTAAHRSLPFNTLVRVTDMKTGAAIHARINDRGPHKNSRIIDLSHAAAQLLGIAGRGVIRVRVEVIGNRT